MAHNGSNMPPRPSPAVDASFPSENLTIGAGVAIFHLASARVVVCYHSRDRYWFLPKGRCNVNETIQRAAPREGFEESGFRNRLLPIPMSHRQPPPDDAPSSPFLTQPVWMQLTADSKYLQYVLYWFVAETVPEEVERACCESEGDASATRVYVAPPEFPSEMTLRQRIAQDVLVNGKGEKSAYQPLRHEGTGVDEEEALYKSYLLPIDEARRRLKGTVMEDVVRRGCEGINDRMAMEDAVEA